MDVAVVTGAGSGIGRAAAERLALCGYQLVLVGRRETALASTLGRLDGADRRRHRAIGADLTDPAGVELIAAEVADDVGPIAALVHCAGGAAAGGRGVVELCDQMISDFASNVTSTAMLTAALAPSLRDGRGRVVATSSIAARRGGGVSYAASKAALHGWAFTVARDLGRRGITVNVVAPGYITSTEFFGDAMTDERHARLVGETLTGRAGEPDDVAAMIEYLVSADAGHVTAQVLQVNGGALAG